MGGGLQNGSLSRWHLHRCHYCDRVMYYDKPAGISKAPHHYRKPSRDHTTPKSKAKGIIGNIVICCHLCNHIKGAMLYEEFFDWMKDNAPYPPKYYKGRAT